MTLIEGIGDEVTQFFLILLAAVVGYIAWWSTNVAENRQFRTVLLLDRRRHPTRSILRVRVPPRQLTNHTETVTISEGSSSNSTTSIQSEESADTTTETSANPSSSANPKPDIVPTEGGASQPISEEGTSSENLDSREETVEGEDLNLIEIEASDIIEAMDANEQNDIRRRRLEHFEGRSRQSFVSQSNESHSLQTLNASSSNKLETNDKQEPYVAEQIPSSSSDSKNKTDGAITIKLKYINDDMRVVDGRLEELLGDFKRRHFTEEMNTNKAVKLIFNGQVLKQDRHSLQSCGLFDNCVVHCLIHPKRPSINDRDGQQSSESSAHFLRNSPFVQVTNNVNNNNQGIDWDLGNFLFALVSFILLAAWYFRYVYAHLYTVTATVGLIIITGVFSIVLLGVYFPDNDMPDGNLRIRVTRTERIEVQRPQLQEQQ